MKKKLSVISILLFITWMSFAGIVQLKMAPVDFNEKLSVSAVSIKSPLSKVTVKGTIFSPRDSSNYTMAEVVFEVMNTSDEEIVDFPLNKLKSIELATADKNGDLEFCSWDVPKANEYNRNGTIKTDNFFKQDTFTLKPGEKYKKTVYYIYRKSFTPVAFMNNRDVIHSMVDEKTVNAEVVVQNLTKQKFIPECFVLVTNPKSTKDDVIDFMTAHNITFTDKDAHGNTVLYYSIFAKKNDIFDVAVEQSDLKQIYYFRFDKLIPIQLAVIAVNDYAVSKLIEMGETLTPGEGDNIGKLVVNQNNLAAAKLLAKYNFDFSTVKMGNGWGPAKTPVQWCKDKSYVELEEFLISLGYTE